eukprot:11716811-Alexandrium_andersonii.AAC.1
MGIVRLGPKQTTRICHPRVTSHAFEGQASRPKAVGIDVAIAEVGANIAEVGASSKAAVGIGVVIAEVGADDKAIAMAENGANKAAPTDL